MTCRPFISIIVPVFNVSEYIIDCIQSIAYQDFERPLECVLVDDCGTDDSIDKARRFIDSYSGRVSFTIVSHSSNKGLSAARNTGMRYVSGDYILFVDSDDVLPANALKTLAKPLEIEQYDVIVGRYMQIGLGDRMGRCIPGGAVFYGHDIARHYLNDEWEVTSWNKLYRKELLSSNALYHYDGVFFEDFLWGMKVVLAAKSLVVIDDITYYYRIRKGSIMDRKDTLEDKRRKLQDSVIVLSGLWDTFLAHGLEKDVAFHEYLERSRIGMYKYAYRNWSLFLDTYHAQRKAMPVGWKLSFQLNGWHFTRQVRDFHLIMCPSFGGVCYYIWWHLRRYPMKFQSLFQRFSLKTL